MKALDARVANRFRVSQLRCHQRHFASTPSSVVAPGRNQSDLGSLAFSKTTSAVKLVRNSRQQLHSRYEESRLAASKST